MPKEFNEYVQDNEERIMSALSRGTAPYWVRDNTEYISVAMSGEDSDTLVARTPRESPSFRKRPSKTQDTPAKKLERIDVKALTSLDKISDALSSLNVEYNEVAKLETSLSETEIISRLGGPDRTTGSCVSLALAYIGNKCGYDVLDFRGGIGRKALSLYTSEIAKSVGGISLAGYNDYTTVNMLLEKVSEGKEYILSTGKHAAIIRKREGKMEFLEMQDYSGLNGFQTLNTKALKDRFSCQEIHTKNGRIFLAGSELIDIDMLGKDNNFKKLLGYINTQKAKQKKGLGGSKK